MLSREATGDVIHRFAEILKFPTISAPDGFSLEPFHNMRSYSQTAWSNVFSNLELEIFGGASILLKWQGDLSQTPVMLAAHQDVVPVGQLEDWSFDPFGGKVSEGRICGRGSIDYKCGYAGMLEAVSLLISQGYKPKRTVYLAFGHDEEIGGLAGAKAIADNFLQRGIQCSSVLDEGGYIYSESDGSTTAELAIAEKGYASFQLTSFATQGHSSVPPDKTAIGSLASAIVLLENTPMPLPEVPLEIKSSRWLETTIAPTILSAGCKENVLPAEAKVVVNTRPSPGISVAQVQSFIQKLVKHLDISVTLLDNASVSEASIVSNVSTRDFLVMKQSIQEVIPCGTGFRCGIFPAATDSRRYCKVAENVYRFMPVHLDHRGIGALHSVDESISIADYLRCVNFYARYISRVAR